MDSNMAGVGKKEELADHQSTLLDVLFLQTLLKNSFADLEGVAKAEKDLAMIYVFAAEYLRRRLLCLVSAISGQGFEDLEVLLAQNRAANAKPTQTQQ